MPVLALKVDIDTYSGIKEGLPKIVEALRKRRLPASFFVSFGPDRSGLALFQLFRPRFLYKMIRTNAPGMYGLRTAFYGTLLKAPMIGLSFPDAVRQLSDMGHEVACHAWDHRLWQDWLFAMSGKSINSWFKNMTQTYVDILGKRPEGFGAPGWMMDKRALEVAHIFGFSYLSCTRANKPFIFKENGLIEIPSNLPCIEEVGFDGVIQELRKRINDVIPQVLPVHTEVEGGIFRPAFEEILDEAKSLGYRFRRLTDIASDLDTRSLTTRSLLMGMIPGRAFKCAL